MHAVRRILSVALLSVAAVSTTAAQPPLSQAEFVRRVALSDLFETRSSELAAIRGDAATRAFAAAMNEAHQKTSSELGLLVKGRASDLPLPPRLDPDGQRRIDRLQELSGESFRGGYAAEQVRAHESAVRLFERYVEMASPGDLRAWAEATLPKLKEHLEHARQLAGGRSGG